MAAGGASLLAFSIFAMLVMSSLGGPRPLCSDCETLCRTNCDAEVETLCGSTCDYNNSGQADCRRQLLKRCTTEGTCCSSNDTCTCDCNTVAQNGCFGVSDGYTRCGSCKLGRFNQCYPTCKNDCNNNCKKKKGCHA
ncbi:unnamed protein product [Triticum turgidum subsp. durum]|uniref:Uncharacterized protein n=1 Tax=Triticum turgidum subsp. durum TaxID=4567 RepID=A0A9R1RV56_TRITD|nr:unnamed protein product [Triticum turgidum subsp. durum]